MANPDLERNIRDEKSIEQLAVLSIMNYYKSLLLDLTSEGRFLLASAFILAGDVKSFRGVLPKAFGNKMAINEFGGSCSSYLPDRSIALNALLETDPNNPQVNELLKSISLEIKIVGIIKFYCFESD